MKNKVIFMLSATLLLTTLSAFAEENLFLNTIKKNNPSVNSNIKTSLQKAYDISTQENAEYKEIVYKPCEVQLIGDFFNDISYNLKEELPIADIYTFMRNCGNITIEGHTSKIETIDKNIINNNKRLSFDRAMEVAKLLQAEKAKNGVTINVSPADDDLGKYVVVKSNKNISSWPTQRNTINNPTNATENIEIFGVGDRDAKFRRPILQPGQKAFSKEEEKTFRWYEAHDRKIIIKGTTK